jgi:hypothetical protein
MKKIILSIAITAAIIAPLCLILGYRMAPDAGPPEIIRETETVTRWVTTPTTCDDCWKCLRSPLEVSGRMDADWLSVTCSDSCRESEKKFQIGCRARTSRNYAGVAALGIYVDGKIRILGGGEYMRNVAGPVMVGGGAYSNGQDHAGKISAGVRW